ncbi:MAG: pilus assembly protein [Paracoccaceae bacterium]|nr:pilus assembly protein [Paracoccaceae bacterium]
MTKWLGTSLRRFRRNSEGNATIEAVLWIPAFFMIFSLIADVSMIFNGHSLIMRTIQDANRNYSVGRFSTTTETSTWVEAQLNNLSPNANAVTSEYAGIATTVVTVPISDLQILGLFNVLGNFDITVRSQHFIEY